MKKNWLQIVKSIAVSALALVLVTNVYAGSLEDVQQEKENAEDQKSHAEEILQELETKKGNLQEYMAELDLQLSDLQGKIEDLHVRKEELESEILVKEQELETARVQEQEQYQAMCARIQFMYENNGTAYMEALISAESMSDILNQPEYVAAMTNYDYNLLNQMVATREAIAEAEEVLKGYLAEVEAVTNETEEEENTVNDLMQAKIVEMEEYNKEIDAQEQLVADLDAEIMAAASQIEAIEAAAREQLEREAAAREQAAREAAEQAAREAEEKAAREAAEQAAREQAEREAREQAERDALASSEQETSTAIDTDGTSTDTSSDSSTTEVASEPVTTETKTESTTEATTESRQDSNSGSGLVWPVPSSYRINSGFGRRESDGGVVTANHYGIDIGCPDGTPCVAAASGVVVLAQYSKTAGNWIIISHGNGMYTIYMHASALYVSAGQFVSAGDTIMLSGATGATQGRHLHFEVRQGGYLSSKYSVNPMNFY